MSQKSKQEQEQEHEQEMHDSYRTIAAPEDTEIKILGSRFLSYAVPVSEGEEFLAFLESLKREHYNATHHCFAWRIGFNGEDFRYSDDGEPSGTAGKRILGSIDREQLTETGIVVVRYFGGTKLGVGGLARAYSDAADAVLTRSRIETRYVTVDLSITFPYDMTSQVHHVIEMHDVDVLDRRYLEDTSYDVRVRLSKKQRFIEDLGTYTNRQVEIQGATD